MSYIIYIMSFSHQVEIWNEKLDSFATEYMDNPWVGAALCLILFVFGCWAVSSLSKK